MKENIKIELVIIGAIILGGIYISSNYEKKYKEGENYDVVTIPIYDTYEEISKTKKFSAEHPYLSALLPRRL